VTQAYEDLPEPVASEQAGSEQAVPEQGAPEQPVPEQSGPTPRLDGNAEVWHIVEVEDVEIELPGSHPEVVLVEKESPRRRLRIPVGFTEANAIAYALRGIEVARPLTHDLMTELLERHNVDVAALRITARHNGIYFGELETMGPAGRAVVPCRPSDGIALVLRQRLEVPVVVANWVFDDTPVTTD
jgi:bifunctional DNase/RNase